VPDLIEPHEIAVQKRLVDSHGRPLGGKLKELDVLRIEATVLERAHMDDPEHPIAGEQRGAKQRFDPFLTQDRIQDVGVIHVWNGDRPALGCDSAGEALPDRDAHAALDFLFDPARGPRDELVGPLVEQENGRSVGVEDLANSLQQLVQEVFQGQVSERGIGDALDLEQALGYPALG
jgi:hypothetical protein